MTGSYLGEEPENLLCSALGEPILWEGEPSLLAAGEERRWLGEVTGRWCSLSRGAGGEGRGWAACWWVVVDSGW